jgi:hypothetical protein
MAGEGHASSQISVSGIYPESYRLSRFLIKAFRMGGVIRAGRDELNERLYFLDTNVLIYAHDVEAGTKHEAAKDILRELWDAHTGRSQHLGLQEF